MNNEKTITRADGTPIPEHERHHARGIAAHWLLIRNDVSAVDRVAARERVADALDALAKLAGNGADEIANAHDSLDQTVARGPGGTEDAEPWTLAERCEVAATEALDHGAARADDNPAREHERHLANLRAAFAFFEEWAEGETYGTFPGGDPRLFTPSQDASTEAERKAHAEACAAWDRGDHIVYQGAVNLVEMTITKKNGEKLVMPPGTAFVSSGIFGHGTVKLRDEKMITARDGLREILATFDGEARGSAEEDSPPSVQ